MQRDTKSALFLPCENTDLFQLMTEESLNILSVFEKAKNTSQSWGGFWSKLDKPTTKFCEHFVDILGEISGYEGVLYGVAPYAPLEEIEHAIYLLMDAENFSYIQCYSDGYISLKHYLPSELEPDGWCWIDSCSDLDTPLFERKRFEELRGHLSKHGIELKLEDS